MPYFATVVVVEAADFDAAYEGVVQRVAGGGDVLFVGEPWEVRANALVIEDVDPPVTEIEFDTDDALNQRRIAY